MSLADKLMIFFYYFLALKYNKEDKIIKQKFNDNFRELLGLFETVTEKGGLFDAVFDNDFAIRCEKKDGSLELKLTLPPKITPDFKAVLEKEYKGLLGAVNDEYYEVFNNMNFLATKQTIVIFIKTQKGIAS